MNEIRPQNGGKRESATGQSHANTCPMEVTLEIVGGKWKGMILYHLRHQTLRFNELRRRMPGVTQRMLTRQLRELEVDHIVRRKVYREIPPKVEYSLSELGRTLTPALCELEKWGVAYMDQVGELRKQITMRGQKVD